MSSAGLRVGALALLLVVPCAAAYSAVQASFAEPAQVQGHLGAQGHWALLLFHNDSASLRVELGASSARNQTWMVLHDYREDGNGAIAGPAPLPASTQDFPRGIRGHLGPAAPWASLYIEAESIRFDLPQAYANLAHADAGSYPFDHLPQDTRFPRSAVDQPGGPQLSWQLLVPEGSAALAIRDPRLGASFPFSLHAAGVTRLEWHNDTLTCQAACPDSGGPYSATLDARGQTRLERLTYVNVDATSGAIDGDGTALAIATGASTLDGTLNGTLRLPNAQLTGQCPHASCPNPDGKTFQAQGHLRLSGLRPAAPGRLQMQMEGEMSSAQFDESPVHGFTLAQKVVIGAAILVGGGCIVVVALFARSARPPALRHPKRRRLHELIHDEPGLSSRTLQRRLDWPRGTLLFHLKRLAEDGHVLATPYKNTVRYFDNLGSASWHGIVLQDPDARRLLSWLQGHPHVDQTRIVQEAEAWGWGRYRVRRHLDDLDQAGFLDREPNGRRVLYTAKGEGGGTPARPSPHTAAPAA